MKVYYIKDVLEKSKGEDVEILGWVASKRELAKVIFLDLVDSSGSIQAVITAGSDLFFKVKEIVCESSVRVKGKLKSGERNAIEVEVEDIEVLGNVLSRVTPSPRSNFNIFERRFVQQFLSRRHLYLRNQKLMAVVKFRHIFFEIMRDWFREEGFIEFHAPILTELLLYDDRSSAFSLTFFDREVFLTQCTAFYLESAVHAFEKIYCINPSFRAEKSKGKRYLAEYWHIKSEIAFADIENIICFVENMISYLVRQSKERAKKELETLKIDIDVNKLTRIPYPRITYDKALERLQKVGIKKEWGKSLSDSDEMELCKEFNSPFWITGMPCVTEPFPYRVDSSNSKITKTADLVATDGFGELLGVAEKIWQPEEIIQRMKEKGKDVDGMYKWYLELRQFGSVPHSGFGMGVERMIRWLLRLNHVRDAIPFPRLFNRRPNP